MAGMGDSQQLWEAEQAALANGPNKPGAYNNKYGFDEYAMHEQVEFCNEVQGVMVGYSGHVPGVYAENLYAKTYGKTTLKAVGGEFAVHEGEKAVAKFFKPSERF